MGADFDFDVFISYSSKDLERVSSLAQRLKADGLRIWIDQWQISPGDNIQLKIEEGLERSRTLLLVMSSNSSDSEWVRAERSTVMFRDPCNESRRFIPLRLDASEIKPSLQKFAYVDWRADSEEEYSRLLAACKPVEVSLPELLPKLQLQPKGFQESIYRIDATRDGTIALSIAPHNRIGVWNIAKGRCVAEFVAHSARVNAVAISDDGTTALTCSDDSTIAVWDVGSRQRKRLLQGHRGAVLCTALTSSGRYAISGGIDRTLRLWEVNTGNCILVYSDLNADVTCVAIDDDARRAVSGCKAGLVRLWDFGQHDRPHVSICIAHTSALTAVAISRDGAIALSASKDRTLKVWNGNTRQCVATLEGHTRSIEAVAITPDGNYAASSSQDKTIRVWNIPAGECVAVLEGHTAQIYGVALTEDGSTVISGSVDHTMRVWDLKDFGKDASQPKQASKYTNAKVLLVGQSGVGKTGLALRLTEDRFEASVSTDAAWATQMKIPYSDSEAREDREIWLWDFAGQADYRLIHQLFMDETALAALVFNPQDDNPFEGLAQWDNDIQRAATRPFKKLLVAARCDRGGLIVSNDAIRRFIADRGFTSFLETSALTGRGCSELRTAIIDSIPWNEIPWTASPRIFRLLKEQILGLRDEGYVLVRLVELKQHLELRLPGESFSGDQLRAVVGLLASPGIVRQLEFGDFVLLKPEYVNAYAAAVVRTVRSHIDEIGSILEDDILAGNLQFEDMSRLPGDQESVVLREMHQMFVDRGLCLREHTESGALLIFPSYFKRERPDLGAHPAAFMAFQFSGSLEEIYATLVVRLHHTSIVEKDALWRWAADFKTPGGKRVGIKMEKKAEGTGELTIYFDIEASDDMKVTFIRYVHDHLRGKDPNVVTIRFYVCPSCGEQVEGHRAIEERKRRGFTDIACGYCDERIALIDLIEEKFQSPEIQDAARKMEKDALSVIDNESRELILVGHAFSIAGEAGQIFRPTANSDWGIDGEIEFKDEQGNASGKRVYLQLKSGDSYLRTRISDGKTIFRITNPRHIEYWQSHNYPVMLVIRTSDGQIRWMDVSRYLRAGNAQSVEVEFDGEPFNAAALLRMRDNQLSLIGYAESVAAEAGHRFRRARLPEWGIDGEIELLSAKGNVNGRIYLQLRPEIIYSCTRSGNGHMLFSGAFPTKSTRGYPGRILLIARNSSGAVQWMDVSKLIREADQSISFVFSGEHFDANALNRMRDSANRFLKRSRLRRQ